MSNNTARANEVPESERPTLIPGAPISLRRQDTSAIDAAWNDEGLVPRHSLVARKGVYGRDKSGTFPIATATAVNASHPIEYDVYEDARILLVLLDLPGIDPEELSIELSSVALHVNGTAPEDPKRQSPLPSGRYAAVIDIPRGIDADSVDASLHNGLLRLRITKPESTAHHIDIVSVDDD